MIYLNNILTEQTATLPDTGLINGNAATFILWSSVDHVEVLRSSVTLNKGHYFFSFNVTLPSGLRDGEYVYHLLQGTTIVSCGVCRIGEYTRVQVQGASTLTFKQAKNGN